MTQDKRFKILFISLCAFFVGLILFNLGKGVLIGYFLTHYHPPAVSVSSVVVKEKDWQPYLGAVGQFIAINGVDVSAETSGMIVQIHIQSGRYVRAREPLVDLDDHVEQAGLKFAEAELALKRINFSRFQTLFTKHAAAQSSLDEANASLKQAEANLDKIKAQIQQKHIAAPFSGKLGIRQINLGQYVIPGETKFVTLQSLDPLYINFYVPEHHFKQLYLNQPIHVELEDYPNLRFRSTITAINAIADANTHNIKVQATIPNCPVDAFVHPKDYPWISIKKDPQTQRLQVQCQTSDNEAHHVDHFAFMPGMFGAIHIELPTTPHAIVIPTTAISYSLYGDTVYLIEPLKKPEKSKNNEPVYQVKRTYITRGDTNGNEVMITSGLKPGDQVVSAGELKLQGGTHVVIHNDIVLDEQTNLSKLSH